MGLVVINGSIHGGTGTQSGSVKSFGELAGLTVGGSMIGGADDYSAYVSSVGDMGQVTIANSIIGGNGTAAGSISAGGKLSGLKLGGSVLGGMGSFSGHVESQSDMNSVVIGGSVVGNQTAGAGLENGLIYSHGKVSGGFQVGGSLVAGTGQDSGSLFCDSDVGYSKIGGDILGQGLGSFSGEFSLGGKLTSLQVGGSVEAGYGSDNGSIDATKGIGSIKIGGDLLGTDQGGNGGATIDSGNYGINSVEIDGSIIAVENVFGNGPEILAGKQIGSILVKGSVVGTSDTRVIFAMGGSVIPDQGDSNLVLGNLTVLGRVEFFNVLAGWEDGSIGNNADAQIGTVHVGGDWIASNLVAGAAALNNDWGDANNTKIVGGIDDPKVTSKIASVTIDGQVLGTLAGGDHFGFVAEEIDSFKVGGTVIPLKSGIGNDQINIGATGDVAIWEIA
jgi:hypothetical protein